MRMLYVLEEERDDLARLPDDGRLSDVLIEVDELELVIVRALAALDSEIRTG